MSCIEREVNPVFVDRNFLFVTVISFARGKNLKQTQTMKLPNQNEKLLPLSLAPNAEKNSCTLFLIYL